LNIYTSLYNDDDDRSIQALPVYISQIMYNKYMGLYI